MWKRGDGLYRVFVFLLLLVVLASCNRSITLITQNRDQYNNEILKKIGDNYLKFQTLSTRVKVESSLFDKKNSLKGQVRIKRDSVVWISLNLSSGFPVAKAVFKTDSFMIHDRVNKAYYHGKYEQFSQRFKVPLTFETIQAMLLNELISAGNGAKFDIKEIELDKASAYSIAAYDHLNCMYNYLVPKEILKVKSTNIIFKDAIVDVSYDDYKKEGGNNFAQLLNAVIKTNSKEHEFSIEFSRFQVDKKTKFNFKVPKKYDSM